MAQFFSNPFVDTVIMAVLIGAVFCWARHLWNTRITREDRERTERYDYLINKANGKYD